MSGRHEWAKAYLEQAKEDLIAAKTIQLDAPSAFCMLMQMTFEKAAKAALLLKGEIQLEKALKTHAAASKLINAIKAYREYFPLPNTGSPYLWKDILPLVTQLERAQPALAGKKPPIQHQLEYPWENSFGEICWPAKHFPMNTLLLSSPTTAPRLLRFAGYLISDIERLF